MILYPFIEGRSGGELGLSDSQWVELSTVLRRLYATRLPAELLSLLPRETFVPPPRWTAVVRQLQPAVGEQAHRSPHKQRLGAFWREHDQEIGAILDRTEQLGCAAQRRSPGFVLCHADIHTANLLITADGRLFGVDWDQPVFARRDRDLMFITVGDYLTEERIEALFFRGYGKAELDPLIMAYYRYERVMEDLDGFGELVFLTDAADETKRDAVKWFMRQFEPGGGVEANRRSDHVLSEVPRKTEP